MAWFRYRHCDCLVDAAKDGGLLAFDLGWPCSWFEYARGMKSVGLDPRALRLAIASHFHMDHAGLVGELLAAGVEVLATPEQAAAIADMERTILKDPRLSSYRRIDRARLVVAGLEEMNRRIAGAGFGGRVVATPGHSHDSISYACADGTAHVGDLAPFEQVMEDDAPALASRAALRSAGARMARTAHAGEFAVPDDDRTDGGRSDHGRR